MTDGTAPIPLDPPRRAWQRRIVFVAAVVGILGGAVAWATTRGAPAPEIAAQPVAAAHDDDHQHDNDDAQDAADAAAGRHRHEALPPYDERYAAATGEEQQAADGLVADVRATLAAYADVDAALAAGYVAPRHPRSALHHYLNPTLARSGDVLDPAKPTGLVYFTGGGEPVLFGAFFVAPKGETAPAPAGDLVVWHSHSPACPGFFATSDEPCLDARRMLHVWTAEEATLVNRNGQPVAVRVVDPFGVPFRASVERVDA